MNALLDLIRSLLARIRAGLKKSPSRGGPPGEEGKKPAGSGGPGPFIPPKSK